MSKNANLEHIALDSRISVLGIELIAGSSFLLVHDYNPYNLCLNVPNFRPFKLHKIELATTFNAFNPVCTPEEQEEARMLILQTLSQEDIIFINEGFERAIGSDYAEFVKAANCID